MEQTFLIGVDIGTTSTKACIFSTTGVLKSCCKQDYPLLTPKPGWAEQKPEAIFEALIHTVRTAIAQAGISAPQIAALSLSSVLHSLIVVDHTGRLLTNSIIWADSRSAQQATRLKDSALGLTLYQRTGVPVQAMSPLNKLIWLREEAPETFARGAKFISIKEYVVQQLFGDYIVDCSLASATGMFNLAHWTWDDEALVCAGVRREQLSDIAPTTLTLRGMKDRYAAAMGLSADVPVVLGAGDGMLANLGVGAIGPGHCCVTVGTSSGLRVFTPTPLTDTAGRTFCYAFTEHHWLVGCPSSTGGATLRWFFDTFGNGESAPPDETNPDSYTELIEAALNLPVGAQGLLLLPFLAGERAPNRNPEARGVFFGVGLHHRREHFVRAILEGIFLSVYSLYTTLQSLVGAVHETRVSGGFASAPPLRQMMADVFGFELLIPDTPEASSYGAALLAMHALGLLPNLTDARKLVRIVDYRRPEPERHQRYQQLYQLFEQVYSNSHHSFTALVDFQ
jgi:gluconokinase